MKASNLYKSTCSTTARCCFSMVLAWFATESVQSATWVTNGAMHVARVYPTLTLLQNGKVLVAGGVGTNNQATASAELYDPASGTWTLTGSLSLPRFLHTANLLPNGKVLVASGVNTNTEFALPSATAELYDPNSGIWTSTGPMTTGREQHSANLLRDGRVLVAGGYNGTTVLQSAELFNPATGSWTSTLPMTTPREGHGAVLLGNGKVLLAGGQ